MLSRSFFPNFGQGSFPKIAGKSSVISCLNGMGFHIFKPSMYILSEATGKKLFQGSHRLKKYLNIEGFLKKVLEKLNMP